MKFKYYVYIKIGKRKHDCIYFDNLSDALKKYKAAKMKRLDDCVYLGIQSEDISPTSGMCFDVLHKFFDNSILINDYLNHDSEEVRNEVKNILNKIVVLYQFVTYFLNGEIIPFYDTWSEVGEAGEMDKKWKEAFIGTCENNELVSVGWKPNRRETRDNYGWNYPKIASIVYQINASYVNEDGVIREIDIDPREFLRNYGYRFSDYKDFI